MQIYLANGIFSESDRLYNKFLAVKIREKFPESDLYVPQENEAINDKTRFANSEQIFENDNYYLDSAQMMIAVIDGPEIDAGVSAEIGRFITISDLDKTKDRIIFGLYSDIRQQGRDNDQKINALIDDGTENQFMYRNLYVIGAIKKHGYIANGWKDLIKLIKERWDISDC